MKKRDTIANLIFTGKNLKQPFIEAPCCRYQSFTAPGNQDKILTADPINRKK